MKIMKACYVALLGLYMMLGGVTAVYAEEQPADQVKNDQVKTGVTVDGRDASGLNAEQLQQLIDGRMQELGNKTMTIKGGEGKSLTPTLTELGVGARKQTLVEDIMKLGRTGHIIQRYKEETDIKAKGRNFTTALQVDESILTEYLKAHEIELGTEKKDGTMSVNSDGSFERIAGIDGTKADVEKTKNRLKEALQSANSEQFTTEIQAEMTVDAARGSEEELAKVKDVLGTYTSNYEVGSVTDTNVSRASNLSTGRLLYPGETLSFASCIMPFTYENGYTSGGAYIDGRIEQVIAGGICQTSSTAYMAAMYAELEIVERHQHSHLVQSVPLSMDATITDGGGLDFKFKNNTSSPIFMVSTVGGGTLTYTFYGQETRPANRKVEYSAVKIDEWGPSGSKVSIDSSLALGSTREIGHSFNGYIYQLWKTVTVDGEQTENTMLYQNTYAPLEGGIAVGAAGANADELARMEAARSGGLSAVQAVVGEVEKRLADDEAKRAADEQKRRDEEQRQAQEQDEEAPTQNDEGGTDTSQDGGETP
ncbi:MAG: VanW family protein [Eubacteriales bacterium]|nr:VanW family protein [Eubacteriales bacterium]